MSEKSGKKGTGRRYTKKRLVPYHQLDTQTDSSKGGEQHVRNISSEHKTVILDVDNLKAAIRSHDTEMTDADTPEKRDPCLSLVVATPKKTISPVSGELMLRPEGIVSLNSAEESRRRALQIKKFREVDIRDRVRLRNVVATACLGVQNIDIDALIRQCPVHVRNPEKFAATVIKIEYAEGACSTCLIFSTSEIVCTGTPSVAHAALACHQCALFLTKQGIHGAQVSNFNIQNMVAGMSTGLCIDIEGLFAYAKRVRMGKKVKYDSELFPGVIIRFKNPVKMVLLAFPSGQVIMTGPSELENHVLFMMCWFYYAILAEFALSDEERKVLDRKGIEDVPKPYQRQTDRCVDGITLLHDRNREMASRRIGKYIEGIFQFETDYGEELLDAISYADKDSLSALDSLNPRLIGDVCQDLIEQRRSTRIADASE